MEFGGTFVMRAKPCCGSEAVGPSVVLPNTFGDGKRYAILDHGKEVYWKH
jgi:hypothetical protein